MASFFRGSVPETTSLLFHSGASYRIFDYERILNMNGNFSIRENKIKTDLLISNLKAAIGRLERHQKPLLFLKLSSNTTMSELKNIASIVNQYHYRVNGIIVSSEKTIDNKVPFDPISVLYKLTSGKTLIIGNF